MLRLLGSELRLFFFFGTVLPQFNARTLILQYINCLMGWRTSHYVISPNTDGKVISEKEVICTIKEIRQEIKVRGMSLRRMK